jgi:Uma2 family endonuclease
MLMNVPFIPPKVRTRHLFTADEVLKLIADGLVDKRAVLLDGEIFDAPEDGDRHISHAMRMASKAIRTLDPAAYFVGVQTTLRLSKHNAPSPDIYILAGGPPQGDVSAERILLVIEVADSSLKDDLTDSASRYARHGVREYWVVDVNNACIHIHREPIDGAYPAPRVLRAEETAQAAFVPGFAVKLAEIG